MVDLPEPKAIIFDLDDTIVASATDSGTLWMQLCEWYSPLIGLDAVKLMEAIDGARNWYWDDDKRRFIGTSDLFKARREIVALAFSNLGIDNTEVGNQLADIYTTQREDTITLFPGAIDTLKHFMKRGFKLALLTDGGSEFQRKKINKFNLGTYFDYILVSGEFGTQKPDEKVFLHTLEQLGVPAGETWMVGDSLARDISGAKKVGIYGIWVDWRKEGLPEEPAVRPDRIVNTISELI